MTSLDGINGRSIQTLLKGENDSKQSDEIRATFIQDLNRKEESCTFESGHYLKPIIHSSLLVDLVKFMGKLKALSSYTHGPHVLLDSIVTGMTDDWPLHIMTINVFYSVKVGFLDDLVALATTLCAFVFFF